MRLQHNQSTNIVKWEGEYRGIYWCIKCQTIIVENEPIENITTEWRYSAGLRGAGHGSSYEACSDMIVAAIDGSIKMELEAGYDRGN